MAFERLIRFVDQDDQKIYGYLETSLPADQIVGLEVQVISGSLEAGFVRTDQRATVKKVRSLGFSMSILKWKIMITADPPHVRIHSYSAHSKIFIRPVCSVPA